MKKIYTFVRKQAIVFAVLSLTFLSTGAFSQSSVCGPIAENFNATSGTTANFTGSFGFASTGGGGSFNGFLQRPNVVARTVYTVTTPTYKLSNVDNAIGYGFELTGTSTVATVNITVFYISTITGQLNPVNVATIVPAYTGSGSNSIATICQTVGIASLPGFPTGGSYRFQFDFTPNTGNGGSNDVIIFDNFRTNGTRANAPLPVSFIGLDAKKVSNGIQLTWKVAGEENVIRYEVERSADGRSFTSIGAISKTGKDTYTYLDANNSGTAYYRVKNVDGDSKFKYSTIARIVNGKTSIVLKAFPLPVQSQLTIQHPVIEGNGMITLSGADGRVVKSFKPAAGSMQTYVDMNTLQKGVYVIRFDAGDGNTETMKVVKQ